MRFLVDECTGPAVAAWLLKQGYEVFSVFDSARGMDDDTKVQKAYSENWILITNDKDFGEKVYREQRSHHGVILLRLDDERASVKISVLGQLLANHAERLPDQFVVVTENNVRFAKQ
jgi:predicted nuclease of predicted toxin-antitoxin system